MFIPDEDNNITGGNTEINTENAPVEPMSINDAGKAFLESLSNLANDTEPVLENPVESNIEVPTDESSVIETNNNTPAATEQPTNETLESIKESILSEIRNMQTANIQPQELEGEEQPSPIPEDGNGIDIDNDKFMEEFSENPVQAVVGLANTIADQKVKGQILELAQKIQPLIQQSEQITFQNKVRDVLTEFASKEEYPDVQKYFPQMAEIIRAKNLPQDDIKTYIDTYKDVALQDLRTNRGKTLEEYLSDDNEITKITGNPKVKEAIIKQYLEEIASGGKPQVISSGGNISNPAATPPTEFKTIAEAGKAFKQHL